MKKIFNFSNHIATFFNFHSNSQHRNKTILDANSDQKFYS